MPLKEKTTTSNDASAKVERSARVEQEKGEIGKLLPAAGDHRLGDVHTDVARRESSKVRSRAAGADAEVEDVGARFDVPVEQPPLGAVQLLLAIVVGNDLRPAIDLGAARHAHARPQARPD